MYSRYHDRDDRPLSIPENYSGCAFSEAGGQKARAEKAASPSHRIEVAKPTPPEASMILPPTGAILLPPPERSGGGADRSPTAESKQTCNGGESSHTHDDATEDGKNTAAPRSALLPQGLFEKLGSAFPFAHGIGFDELLILGLILLLARSESDSDLILWLVLLLFCG